MNKEVARQSKIDTWIWLLNQKKDGINVLVEKLKKEKLSDEQHKKVSEILRG